jgi:predicted acylesterase/phospholipase RssA
MSSEGRVAFVLAGGASLGAVEVGMLRSLYERGPSRTSSWRRPPVRMHGHPA